MAGHPTPKSQKNQKTHKTTPKQKKTSKKMSAIVSQLRKLPLTIRQFQPIWGNSLLVKNIATFSLDIILLSIIWVRFCILFQ